jgi:hypothetical protein
VYIPPTTVGSEFGIPALKFIDISEVDRIRLYMRNKYNCPGQKAGLEELPKS